MGRDLRRGAQGSVLVAVVIFLGLVLLGSGVGILAGILHTAPKLSDVQFNPKWATIVYDERGDVIGRLFTENRTPVGLDRIPKDLKNAVIAIEDDHFYDHHGIRVSALFRALVVDLLAGGKVQGGSTITQQLARNAFLSLEKTFSRKINEIIWAIQIERRYTKDEILETYLNEIYLGHGTYGVESASQLYFGKHVEELNLSESALLAGLLRGPEIYSPYVNPQLAKERRDVVLDRMARLGYLTPAEAEAAKEAPIKTVGLKLSRTKAPYFVEYVTQYLLDRYGASAVYSGGLKVYTTLDLKVQEAAERALSRVPIAKTDKNGLHQPQAALLAMDPRNGHLKAMVGGRGEDKYNRATQAYRQPGSAIKPFIYTAAIDRGFTPISIVDDSPLEYPMPDGSIWAPQNYDKKFRGPVTLRAALEDSVNIVAIKLLEQIGIGTVIDYARKMGVTSLVEEGTVNDRNLSLALGGITKGVTLMEMVTAYSVLANQGIRVEPLAILRVEDKDGRVLEENTASKQIVLADSTAYVVTDMMRGVIERGTGRAANIGRPAAGKTGTTSDYTNAWFVGFTPELVTAVWIGNDVQKEPLVIPKYGNLGSAKAAEIWGDMMRQALADTPISDFPLPPGVTRAYVDAAHGYLATDRCLDVRLEVFIQGTEPTQPCPFHTGRPLPPPVPPELPPASGNYSGQAGGSPGPGAANPAAGSGFLPPAAPNRSGPPLAADHSQD
ncbi:MAG: penicillin-binding protein 1A [Bacillota bacterium]|nr:penicillin-binding protein 1A [Bacillota bacterium]